MSREVLQQALEALNKLTDVFLDTEGNHGDYEQKALNQGNKTILAIKAALAQPEQEPVAKVVSSGEYGFPVLQWLSANHSLDTAIGSLLYMSPPQRQTEQEHAATVIGKFLTRNDELRTCIDPELPLGTKLYTSPPKREWVGLTDEDHNSLWKQGLSHESIHMVDAYLKEKNT